MAEGDNDGSESAKTDNVTREIANQQENSNLAIAANNNEVIK